MRRLATLIALAVPALVAAQGGTVNWPTYSGTEDHSHYSTLSQITPANVNRLRVAWTYETHDEFPGSEMQANPIVVDGVLYATTPKLRVIALNAETGREIWSFDPTEGKGGTGRFRHRGVIVHNGRVYFTHRNRLWSLDATTGRPITTFGASGRVDLREGLDRPIEGVTVSASTPGVVFEDLLIMGSTVSESPPGSPGHIRDYDVNTGALRWIFHTIPHPGEFGYETWPADAWKISGGANAWAGLTVDTLRGIVYGATGSASFDFYGSNRHGDNPFANTVLALDARTGKRVWHFQGIHHDLWDLDFPAPPALVTVQRDGKPVDALAQVTKTGHVWLFDRRHHVRQEVPRLRQAHRHAALGDAPPRGRERHAVALHGERPPVRGHRLRRRQERCAVGRHHRRVRAPSRVTTARRDLTGSVAVPGSVHRQRSLVTCLLRRPDRIRPRRRVVRQYPVGE